MELGLQDRVVLVAGSSRGLGYGIAAVLAAEGAKPVLGARDAASLQQAAARLQQTTGYAAHHAPLDMRDAASIRAWVQSAREYHGRIDAVVVNAGGPPAGRFGDFDDAAWQAAFELTLLSAVRLVRETLPALRAQRGGSLLLLASSSVKEPIDHLLLSNVLRAGVAGLAKSLSRELAAEGIRVNTLVPGVIATERMTYLDEAAGRMAGLSAAQQRAQNETRVPLGRYGEPDEFARAAAFLLSDAASYITGATLVVDGGAMRSV